MKRLNKFKAPELFIIFLLWGWAAVLIAPKDTFSLGGGSYKVMASMFSETTWGLIAITLGIIHVLSVLNNKPSLQYYSLMFIAFFWATVTASFAFSNLFTTATPTYFCIAALTSWLAAKVKEQRKLSGKGWCNE